MKKLVLSILIALTCNPAITAMQEYSPADVLNPYNTMYYYPSIQQVLHLLNTADKIREAHTKAYEEMLEKLFQQLRSKDGYTDLSPLELARRFGSAIKPYTWDLATSAGRGFRNIGSSIRSGFGNASSALESQADIREMIYNAIAQNSSLKKMWTNLNQDTKVATIAILGALLTSAAAAAFGIYQYRQPSSETNNFNEKK